MDTDYYTVNIDAISAIDSVEFDVLSNEEIKRMSALGDGPGIEIPDLHDNSEPKKGGLIDSRLGTSSNDINCATCGLNTTYCGGHFGHIDLAEVVFHIGYLPFVHKIMTCICPRCSKLLVYRNENEIKELLKTKTGKERMAHIRELAKSITHCAKDGYGCGAPIPKIKIDTKKSSCAINFIAEMDTEPTKDAQGIESKKKLRQILTPDLVYNILRNISDQDCLILGMDPTRSRPEYMLHKVFPVPPVQVRPSSRGDFMGGTTVEDDLTHKLADIVKANLRIIRNKETNENNTKYHPDHAYLLQYHIITYFENDSAYALKSELKGKPFRSISSRLKTKEGRVRGNLMGKRGDFTARTVITSDPTISNNQLGVPVKIAMNLTFPEIVTPQNIDQLSILVRNGRDVYPGANFVFPVSSRASGKRLLPIDLRYRKEKIELKFGDVVERHLINDDIVLLNRQPTLHKQSMMGHRIKVIDDPTLMTFRLSVAITTPYNADFDGDEMNIFLPQSIQTRIELEEIVAVERQIIAPTTSKAIIGIVQDGLLGAYNLTSPTIKIDWRNAMNIMSYTTLDNFSHIKKNNAFSGSELYSLIIPPNINVNKPTLKIKNSAIVEGRLSKDILGPQKKNNLIQLIWDGYGANATREFIDNTQKLVNNFNLYDGFSVGIGDSSIPKEITDQIHNLIETKDLKINHMITEIENNPNLMAPEIFEMKLFSEINIIRDDSNKLVQDNLGPKNAFGIMMASGSKGDTTNIGQIMGCLGLQAFEGSLMPKKYGGRTLAYFHKGDDRPAARGFVRNSFVRGIEFPEFVFDMISGRIGTIDAAIKTADTGYAQRRIIKSLEDIMVKYDGTVRTANEAIIQLVYGDSGNDTTKQYECVIRMLEMNNEELAARHKFSPQELKNFKDFSEKQNEDLFGKIKELRDKLRHSVMSSKMNYKIVTNTFMLPINVNRIIDTVSGRAEDKGGALEPNYILGRIEEMLTNEFTTLMTISKKNRTNPKSFKLRDEKVHKTVFKVALYDALSPKRMIVELGLGKGQFDDICGEFISSYNKNLIEPGEMIGIIAAQSAGEPLTQMSVVGSSRVCVRCVDGRVGRRVSGVETVEVEIGVLIDELIRDNSKNVAVVEGHPDSLVLDVEGLQTLSVDPETEEIGWASVAQVSRHPVNGGLMCVTTREGFKVTTTLSHSHLGHGKCQKIVPVKGSKLRVGDEVPIMVSMGAQSVVWDTIVAIDYVEDRDRDRDQNQSQWVYDFTVPGRETFGVVSGQGGAIFVHNTLKSFHHAGIASMSTTIQGVPRIKELLSVSKNPKSPQMIVYLTENFRTSKDMCHKIASHIKHTTLGDIRGKVTVFYDPNPKDKNGVMANDGVINVFYHKPTKTSCQSDVTSMPWLIRIEIDREKMLEKEVTLLEITSKFCNWWEKRNMDIKQMKKEEKKVMTKITQLSVLSNTDSDKQPIIHIRFNAKDTDKDKDRFDLGTINGFIDLIIDKFMLKGIADIVDTPAIPEERLISFNKETGEIERSNQYVIYTAGVNLEDIRYLVGIDLNRTLSNDIVAVCNTYGIEVARSILISEITNAYERAGSEINYQHISLIADQMTSNGSLNSIDRHGVVKSDIEPFSRASFEQTVDHLLKAAIHGEIDHMKGVSSRIMAGQVVKGGTGYCDVVLDTEMIEKSEYVEEVDYSKKFTELNAEQLANDIIKKQNADIFIPIG